jgi:hypothetical protein
VSGESGISAGEDAVLGMTWQRGKDNVPVKALDIVVEHPAWVKIY